MMSKQNSLSSYLHLAVICVRNLSANRQDSDSSGEDGDVFLPAKKELQSSSEDDEEEDEEEEKMDSEEEVVVKRSRRGAAASHTPRSTQKRQTDRAPTPSRRRDSLKSISEPALAVL